MHMYLLPEKRIVSRKCSGVKLTGIVIVGICLVFCALIGAEEKSGELTILDSATGKSHIVPLWRVNDSDMVHIDDLTSYLGGHQSHDPLARIVLVRSPDHTLVFQIGKPYFFVENTLLRLSSAVISTEAGYLLPMDVFVRLLPLIRSCTVSFDHENMKVVITPGSEGEVAVREGEDEVIHTPPPLVKKMQGRKIRSITLDPGHGGKDSGANGPTGVQEKSVVLKIAMLLREELKAKYGLDVFLTRTDDTFLTLQERTALANKNHSDLFLSIHTNSGKIKSLKGFEVYYLNRQPSDDRAREAALLENLADSPEGDSAPPMGDDVQTILWDLIQNKYLEESSILANRILASYEREFSIRTRGVKQAPFMVLLGAEMPAVLIEVDFISNPVQEKKLLDDQYIGKIVSALVAGIIEFRKHYEKVLGNEVVVPNE